MPHVVRQVRLDLPTTALIAPTPSPDDTPSSSSSTPSGAAHSQLTPAGADPSPAGPAPASPASTSSAPASTTHGNGARPSGHQSGGEHSGRPAIADPPVLPPLPLLPAVTVPLSNLGKQIAVVPGFGAFAGPYGWMLTALLLLGALMVVLALALGHRRERSARGLSR